MSASTKRRKALVVAALTWALLDARAARAADPVCAEAAENAQDLRSENKLLKAFDLLVRCSAEDCATFIRSDCLKWLAEVQASLPTVVMRVRDAAGADVVDATLTLDGAPVELTGAAVPVDPGVHVIAASSGDRTAQSTVLIGVGEKNRVVIVTLSSPTSAPLLAPPPPVEEAPSRRSATGLGPWPWVTAGIGAAGLVAFGVFQGLAQARYDELSDSCGRSGACSHDDVMGVRRDVVVSAVGLGVAVAGALATVGLVVLSPKHSPSVGSTSAPGVWTF